MDVTKLGLLPLEQRLQALEVLWASLVDDGQAELATPQDHDDVVAGRLARYRSGKSDARDWDEVKRELRRDPSDRD